MVSLLGEMEQRAQALKVSLQPLKVRRLDELDATFQLAREQTRRGGGRGWPVPAQRRTHRRARGQEPLPSIGFREYCEAGGLLAYGVDFPDIWRQGAVLVDKIFKGAKPADLPIQQATRFELVINLKTAKALGLAIPPSVLARADQLIGE